MNIVRKISIFLNLVNDYSKMGKKITGKNKFFDILFSRIFLGVPFPEYFNLCFYNKPWRGRQNYLFYDWPLHVKYNPGITPDCEDDKIDLLQKTKPYMKRKIITNKGLTFEDLKTFSDGLESFFYKPAFSYGGIGIQKFFLNGKQNLSAIYDEIVKLPVGLLEETVVQDKEMDKLCPNLLQTVRFTVFKHKDGPRILFATLKTSIYKNSIVDNATSGGVFANIDLDTGMLQTNAYRFLSSYEDIENFGIHLFDENGLDSHPVTGTKFKGFQLPRFNESKEFVLDIAKNVNFYNRRLLGIDIAITEKGPVLIEVNTDRPGISHLWQTACKSTPVKPLLNELLRE